VVSFHFPLSARLIIIRFNIIVYFDDHEKFNGKKIVFGSITINHNHILLQHYIYIYIYFFFFFLGIIYFWLACFAAFLLMWTQETVDN
jgi:hypothetical protein